jgi:NAD(P)H-hydrate epimerase
VSEPLRAESIPAVTPAQMAEIDRLMASEFGVEPLQLMETAGHAVASFARRRFLGGDSTGKRVIVLCGTGGNGGDGLVAARYLHAWGALPQIWIAQRPNPERGLASHQLNSVERLGIPVHEPSTSPELPSADLLIDALLGFSISGPPKAETAGLIAAANAHAAPTLAVDLPSGLSANDGAVFAPCIQADVTLTLALPKTGLLAPGARSVVGELVVADIGVPPEAFAKLGIPVKNLFNAAEYRSIA